jgi:superoxide reductase
MEPKHYIEWIEVIQGDAVYRRHLDPGDLPEADFPGVEPDRAREYCNVHGHWKSA